MVFPSWIANPFSVAMYNSPRVSVAIPSRLAVVTEAPVN
jgi:hypothetical protein